MTMDMMIKRINELENTVQRYEAENFALRVELNRLRDESATMQQQAEFGKATETFIKEIKRIMR